MSTMWLKAENKLKTQWPVSFIVCIAIAALFFGLFFTFFNTLQPATLTGTVPTIKEQKFEYTIDTLSIILEERGRKCARDNLIQRNRCYHKIAEDIIGNFSFKDILAGLKVIQDGNPLSSYHDFLHYLAREEFSKQGNIASVLRMCTPVYFNACYHGATSGYIERSGFAGASRQELAQVMLSACDSLKEKGSSGFYSQCIHGMGHGLMLLTDMELPKSLELCDLLGKYREICYGGVFMENFPGSATSDHPVKYIKEDDPLYPCSILQEKYLSNCYTFLTSHFRYLSGYDEEKTARMCEVVPEKYRGDCYITIGSGGAGQYINVKDTIKACNFVPSGESREFCIKGIVIFFADRFGGNNEKMFRMFDFCEIVEEASKQTCYSQIGTNLKSWVEDGNERAAACARITMTQERELCLEAADATL